MFYEVLLLVSHVTVISSSMVIDSAVQRSVYVTDYCPKMKFCAEGAHVMCMYYNSKSQMGPRCSNAQNISITPDLAEKLLDVTNAIRSRIAQGTEKGKHGILFPRGYGIFRLSWDIELATFAQVLANQCVLKHDLCRSTKRFPDPGQTAGLVRFSYPDWFPVSKSGKFTTPGLDSAKLMYATTQALKSWYGQKNLVTPEMINNYPDWTLTPNKQDGRLYMEMIYGSATHMGCGISGYTDYAFHDNNAPLNYNSIQIMCNYSARPKKGTAVYNTVPPSDTDDLFNRCGCPAGSEADEQCLCQMIPREPYPPTPLKQEIRQCPKGETCDPPVVVLPIFTVEDAPPEKLLHQDSFTNTSLRRPTHNSIFESGYEFQKKRNFASDKQNTPPAYKAQDKSTQKQSRTQNIRPTAHHQTVAIRNRYFDKKHLEKESSPVQHHAKISVFSRAATFELPGTLSIRPTKTKEIKDVVPRKDFTIAKQLVNKYLYGKNDLLKSGYNKPMVEARNDNQVPNNLNVLIPHETVEHPINKETILPDSLFKNKQEIKRTQPFNHETKNENLLKQHEMKNVDDKHHLHDVFNILNATKPNMRNEIVNYQNKLISTTENILHRAEQNVIVEDTFLKQIVSNANDYNNFGSVTEESDNKLMALLDTLEQEIKHIELRDKDRQLFDAKIKKIYGKVVGKPANLLELSVNEHTKREKSPDVYKPYIMKQSVQQEPKEETLDERYSKKVAMDASERRSDMNLLKFENSTSNLDHIDGYDEKSMYRKRNGFMEARHRDISKEQRNNDYERYQDYTERRRYKTNNFDRNSLTDLDEPRQRGTDMEKLRYRKYDFDRNTLTDLDEPRQRGAELKYRSRNTERDSYRDNPPEQRNYEPPRLMNDHRHNDLDKSIKKNYYINNDGAIDDPLSLERRRFYQNKLDNIERKLQMRHYKKRKDKTRHMRPVRPAARKSESQMDIYGRGRFAHGY